MPLKRGHAVRSEALRDFGRAFLFREAIRRIPPLSMSILLSRAFTMMGLRVNLRFCFCAAP